MKHQTNTSPDNVEMIEAIEERMKRAKQELWGTIAGGIGGIGIFLVFFSVATKPWSSILLGVGSFLFLASFLTVAWTQWRLK